MYLHVWCVYRHRCTRTSNYCRCLYTCTLSLFLNIEPNFWGITNSDLSLYHGWSKGKVTGCYVPESWKWWRHVMLSLELKNTLKISVSSSASIHYDVYSTCTKCMHRIYAFLFILCVCVIKVLFGVHVVFWQSTMVPEHWRQTNGGKIYKQDIASMHSMQVNSLE